MTDLPSSVAKKPGAWLPSFLLRGKKLLLLVRVEGPKGDAGVVFVDRERWIVAFQAKGSDSKVWREVGDGSFVDALFDALEVSGKRKVRRGDGGAGAPPGGGGAGRRERPAG